MRRFSIFLLAFSLVIAVPAAAAAGAATGGKTKYAKAKRGKAKHKARWQQAVVPAPAPAAPTAPAPPRECHAGVSSAELTLDRSSAAEGERFTMRLRNTGPTCLSYGSHYRFERLSADGRWVSAGETRPGPDWAAGLYPGEQSGELHGYVWEELEAGRHRVVYLFAGPDGEGTATAELDVTS